MSESILVSGQYLDAYESGIDRLSVSEHPSELLAAVASRLINGAEQSELDQLRYASKLAVEAAGYKSDLTDATIRDAGILQQMEEKNIFEKEVGGLQIIDLGSFVVTHFALRGLRPPGTATEIIKNTEEPYDPTKFNYTKIISETILEYNDGKSIVNVVPNKFPFAKWHGLWVPRIDQKLPQRLRQREHEEVLEQISGAPEGYLIGFNGRGAYSSVNHTHFHVMKDDTRVPAIDMQEDYPAERVVFDHGPESMQLVEELYARNIPISVLYTPSNVIIFPREFQGKDGKPEWSSGFGVHEMSGVVPITNESHFNSVTDHDVAQALAGASRELVKV